MTHAARQKFPRTGNVGVTIERGRLYRAVDDLMRWFSNNVSPLQPGSEPLRDRITSLDKMACL